MCLEVTTESWVGVDDTDGGGEIVPYVGASVKVLDAHQYFRCLI